MDALTSALRTINDTREMVTLKTFDGQSYSITFLNMNEELFLDPVEKQREYIFTITATESDVA